MIECYQAGLSGDLIIHPGETIADIMKERKISYALLAAKTGMTQKYISRVVDGKIGISGRFSRQLERAFGIEASFWVNLQALYESEVSMIDTEE